MRGAVSNTPSSDSAAPIASDSRNPTFRWPTLLAVLLWAAVSAVLVVTTVPLRMPRAGLLGGGDDFDAYRDGVQHALAHLPLYSEPLIHQHLYTYPPFSAVAFLPFAMLPFGADTYIWFAVNVVGARR